MTKKSNIKICEKKRKEIPIFFAADDNYIPFLAVSIKSMLENASTNYKYVIKILHTNISNDNMKKILKLNSKNVDIEFVDVTNLVNSLNHRLHTCIYYTQTTYFRLFIPNLYPQYKKVIYLDCDIVVRQDISKLYNTNIGNNLLGAATDQFVVYYEKVHNYIYEGLGFDKLQNYFNAGILIMNLKELRAQNFEEKFINLLEKYKFIVQDQDYLNIICKDKVFYIDPNWNAMPCNETLSLNNINLIHYNLIWKPWHADVLYSDEFWKYVNMTQFADEIKEIKDNYSKEKYDEDVSNFNNFMECIANEGKNPNNYYHKFIEKS